MSCPWKGDVPGSERGRERQTADAAGLHRARRAGLVGGVPVSKILSFLFRIANF